MLQLTFLVLIGPMALFSLGLYDLLNSFIGLSIHQMSLMIDYEYFFSLGITLISTFLSIYIGAWVSYSYLFRSKNFSKGIHKVVIFLPHIGFAYLVYLMFSPTGFLFRVLNNIYDFGEIYLTNDRYGLGIIIHYFLKEVIFVSLFMTTGNSIENKNLIINSFALGADKLQSFFKVYLPLKRKTLFVLSVIIFSYSFGSYEAPYLLGANYPKLLSVRMFENFQSIEEAANIISDSQAVLILLTSLSFSAIAFLSWGRKSDYE